MEFNPGYYTTMSKNYFVLPDYEMPSISNEISATDSLNVGPKEIGASANPMEHPIKAIQAKLKEGARKIEITFMGKGKGNSQSFTPESIDKLEREEIRALARLNNTKISTHATPNVMGLTGFTGKEFDDRARYETIKEIEKAIDFAAEASTGGAIVFHLGEWQRPISEQKFGVSQGGDFSAFETEPKEALIMAVDSKTGQILAKKKNNPIYEPDFMNMKDFIEMNGLKQDSNGNYIDSEGNVVFKNTGKDYFLDPENKKIYLDNWVDMHGNRIIFDPKNPEQLFNRVPKWDSDGVHFKTVTKTFQDFVKESKKYKERFGIDLKPEEFLFKLEYIDKALEAKGSSIYHGRMYDETKYRYEKIKKLLDHWEKIEDKLSPEEKERFFQRQRHIYDLGGDQSLDVFPDTESKIDFLKRKLKDLENEIKYIHQASGSADARAREIIEQSNNISTFEDYGLKRTAESLAYLARKVYEKNKNKPYKDMDDLYLAPENFPTEFYGGHPEEMITIIKKAREKFIENNKNLLGEETARKEAQKLIKSTIDVGHLNTWRKHFERRKDETDEQFNKRFNNWLLNEIDKMHKENVLGHFHLADNFGFDDEHLTPGRGNAPIKEFIKMLREKGYDEFIVESGSFNGTTSLHDTWSYFGSQVYSSVPVGNFRNFRNMHFQYRSSPLYIAGAYAPSNQFKTWTEVPLH